MLGRLWRWLGFSWRDPNDPGSWMLFLSTPPLVGIAALACYAAAVAGFRAFAVGVLAAAGAFVTGALLGFLFAIPRSTGGTGERGDAWFKSSTSLEEISDWLTKILVGLGLVELGSLAHQLGRLVDLTGPALAPADDRKAVALGIFVLYSVSGFLLFYLATRIYLAPAFATTEEKLRKREAAQVAADVLRSSSLLTSPPDLQAPAGGG